MTVERPKAPRRAWIDLSEAVRTLPLTAAEREPIARVLAGLLTGRPDFNPHRFHQHALAPNPQDARY